MTITRDHWWESVFFVYCIPDCQLAVFRLKNKVRSRDRRFSHSYGELTLAAQGGLNEAFMTSRVEPCQEFATAVRDLQRAPAAGSGARTIGSRKAIPGRR